MKGRRALFQKLDKIASNRHLQTLSLSLYCSGYGSIALIALLWFWVSGAKSEFSPSRMLQIRVIGTTDGDEQLALLDLQGINIKQTAFYIQHQIY